MGYYKILVMIFFYLGTWDMNQIGVGATVTKYQLEVAIVMRKARARDQTASYPKSKLSAPPIERSGEPLPYHVVIRARLFR